MTTMPYICEGTIVRTITGHEGKVVGVDRKLKIAVISAGKTTFTELVKNLKVVSYKGVE